MLLRFLNIWSKSKEIIWYQIKPNLQILMFEIFISFSIAMTYSDNINGLKTTMVVFRA